MKKSLLWLVVVLLSISMIAVFSLAGCKCKGEEAAPAEKVTEEEAAPAEEEAEEPVVEEKVVIGAAMVDVTNPFFVDVMKGGDQMAGAMNAEVIWKSSEGNLEKQIALIETFIEQDVDVIFIDPLDPVAVIPAIEKAYSAGIPTITAANLVETPGNVSTPFPAKAAFKMLVDMVAAYLDYEGNILYSSGIPGNWILDQYLEGVEEGVAQYENIVLLDEQPAKMDPALSQRIMEGWLTAYDEISAVIFTTDPDMYSAIEAIKNADRINEFPLFSQNGDVKAVEMIQNNNENGVTIDLLSGATRIGAFNIMLAIRIARGEKLPDVLWFGYLPVMNQDTWDYIVEKGFDQDVEWITPEVALEIVANADSEFLNWEPPAE